MRSQTTNLKTRALFLAISALFFSPVLASGADLAKALYAEGDWPGARREALRTRLAQPDSEVAGMIHALATLRLDSTDADAREEADRLIREAGNDAVRARTAYELGRIDWAIGEPERAASSLKQAFSYSAEYDLFLKTAYSLEVLLQRHPDALTATDPVRTQLRTMRPLITRAAREAATPPTPNRRSVLSRFARAPVRFYQTQIGPAIGQRCSMHPSCSTYCAHALQRYGALAIPMTADRLIRETDHVNHRINPVIINGVEKYYDPLSDHTFWFRRYRR